MRDSQVAENFEVTFVFGTKAETLERLRPLVSLSRLCDQVVIGVSEWRAQRTPTVERVLKEFGDQRLVVRWARHSDTPINPNPVN